MFTEAVIDGGHGLDDTGGRTGESELAVLDLAFVQTSLNDLELDEGESKLSASEFSDF